MTHPLDSDEHGIIEAMQENGSYVHGQHIVYKAGTHGEIYFDKDAHLASPDVPRRIIQLLSEKIPHNAIIIAPETRSQVRLGAGVAENTWSRLIQTVKVGDKHTLPNGALKIFKKGGVPVLVDDILNNGETLKQIQTALAELKYTVEEFHVMVNRNPVHALELDLPVYALATVQTEQWEETRVPPELKKKAISTSLGKGRNWIPKPGQELSMQFYLERLHKEELGFHLDDDKKVVQIESDGWFLQPR
jgi:orotate phosphoribosyltransferase